MSIVIGGCIAPPNNNNVEEKGYNVTDARGKKVNFSTKPQRIISLHYSTDEILLDLLPAERILSISKSGREPALSHVVSKAESIKKTTEENLEFMMVNNPDLVIIRENYKKEFIQSLEDAGIKVVVVRNPKKIAEIPDYIKQIASAVGEPEAGDRLCNDFIMKLKKLKIKQLPESMKPSVLIASSQGVRSFKGSIVEDIIQCSQLKSAVNDHSEMIKADSKMLLNKEEIVNANPDIILLIDWSIERISKGDSLLRKEYMNDMALQDIKAIQRQAVYLIPMKSTICFTHYVYESILDLNKLVNQEGLK